MPDLSKAEVERRLEAIRINAGTVLTLDQTAQTEALQTALSLYDRAEQAEQERDEWKLEALSARDRDAAAAERYKAMEAALRYIHRARVPITTLKQVAGAALTGNPYTLAALDKAGEG